MNGATMTNVTARCWRCGRFISDPLSCYVGMGPICRQKCGLVKARGWQAVEQLRWWKDDVTTYHRYVNDLSAAFSWWRMRLMLVAPGEEQLFGGTMDTLATLRPLSPHDDAPRLMRLLGCLIAQVRFVLEDTLQELARARVVPCEYVEGVPELRVLMPAFEGILCGLGAKEDAVELNDVRLNDIIRRRKHLPVEPMLGIE